MEEEVDEETKKLQKKKQQLEKQPHSSLSASKPSFQTLSPLNHEMSSRSSLHSVPQTTVDSPPDSPTVSSIPDSHGSSPHTIIPTPSVASVATKTETPFRVTNGDFVEEQIVGDSRRQLRPSFSYARRESNWGSLIRKALLGFRVTAFVSCLVSFSVMVADRDKGWARDSFYHYKEFRFKVSSFLLASYIHTDLQVSEDGSYNDMLGTSKTMFFCLLDDSDLVKYSVDFEECFLELAVDSIDYVVTSSSLIVSLCVVACL